MPLILVEPRRFSYFGEKRNTSRDLDQNDEDESGD